MDLIISGDLKGRVNGAELQAITSGALDTTGNAINTFEIRFLTAMPSGFNPIVTGHCYYCSSCALSFLPIPPASNIQNLSAFHEGRYISSRTTSFPTLSNENRIKITSEVLVDSNTVKTSGSQIDAIYNGPTDVYGVFDVNQEWKLGDDHTSIKILTYANLRCHNGASLPIEIETLYTELKPPTGFTGARSKIIYGNQVWNGTELSFNWTGVVF